MKELESEKAFFCVGEKALSTQECFSQATEREKTMEIVGALSTPMSGERSSENVTMYLLIMYDCHVKAIKNG